MIRMCHASSSAKKTPCWKAVTSKPHPSLACINQTKVFPPPRVFEVSNTTSPHHNPKKEGILKVGLLFQPYYSLYRDHILTLNYKWTYFLITKITFFVWVFNDIPLPLCCLHDDKLKWLHTNWKQSNYDQ